MGWRLRTSTTRMDPHEHCPYFTVERDGDIGGTATQTQLCRSHELDGRSAHTFETSWLFTKASFLRTQCSRQSKQRIRSSTVGGRHKCGPNHSASKQTGFVVVHLCLLWLPLFAILGVTLCIRYSSLHSLLRQRSLDRCLYPALRAQCETINQISQLNQGLRSINRGLAVFKTLKTLGGAFPPLRAALLVIDQTAANTARILARRIAQIQDARLKLARFQLSTIQARALTCGFSTRRWEPPHFVRQIDFESAWGESVPPLEWHVGPTETLFRVYEHSFHYQSFGHCAPRSRHLKNKRLSGEQYVIAFQDVIKAKHFWNVWSFSR